jgi:hypothetical protein
VIHDSFHILPTAAIAGQVNQSDATHDHLLAEFLVYFFKSALDRPQPLLTVEEADLSLKLLLRAIREHNIHLRDKEELLEVMEILTLFTGTFQRQN